MRTWIGIGPVVGSSDRGWIVERDLPPARVSAEEGDVSAIADECLDVVAHPCRPVFVMADVQQQTVGAQHVATVISVNVEVGTVVNRVAVGLKPRNEGCVPVAEGLSW